ncbi:unnamed protein product [Diplocarpon coronariae]|uniref:Uncharacterized protein n=1 Tax=Diplocarpon coronariae TaxID=2795749 RepID=A0A218ZAV4_9HELO|nr:hypothetical protein B2J93_4420 [Marssonina coronariae]
MYLLAHASVLLLPFATCTVLSVPRDAPPFSYRNVTLSLFGGPASYTFSFPADGGSHSPSVPNPLTVSQIVSENFNIFYSCNLYFAAGPGDGKAVVLTSNAPGNEVAVGPPRALAGIACQPTAGGRGQYCLPEYGELAFGMLISGLGSIFGPFG